ncbi:FtsQ-type POTRA domain-containing protein [Aliishimia ponticola]|uniref:Cell division protein FtsQ n=1 Tax=Aliishimia ponticola TaxID=2499833 RepID=A0A4S4NH97_9RHOB|nr:cell division protein FtsQ/DivIB [Aliishimia ponticola]THH39052.1 FtsQ-type POTRA domain-containing protein [Aliishimia ponticola]
MRPLNWLRRDKPRKADPAPSRWAWRLERWMLTPSIRLALRAGIPFALAFGAVTGWFSVEENRMMVLDTIAELRASVEQRPEFMVNVMAVEGAGPEVAADIRDIMPFDLPTSSFDLDLEQLRDTIEGLDPVAEASLRIRSGGVLEVDVTERTPVAVWRTYEQLTLIDAGGAHVAEIPTRLARPDLPLIAGDGADKHVPEALALIQAADPLGDRMRGLVRIGERRWDVVLDRDQRILLPEEGALQALERVIALDEAQDLLARDIARVDMRLGDRPTVQMNEAATQAWWQIRAPAGAVTQAGDEQ